MGEVNLSGKERFKSTPFALPRRHLGTGNDEAKFLSNVMRQEKEAMFVREDVTRHVLQSLCKMTRGEGRVPLKAVRVHRGNNEDVRLIHQTPDARIPLIMVNQATVRDGRGRDEDGIPACIQREARQ